MAYPNITIDLIKGLFKELNQTYFHNSLPLPKFRVATARTHLGHCKCGKKDGKEIREIMISDYYKVPIDAVTNTLLHEMVHLWEWVRYGKMSHGANFKRMAQMIAIQSDNKYIITRTNSRTNFELTDNAKHKMLTSRKAIPKFMVALEKKDNENYAWIVKLSNPMFESLKESKTIGKLSIVGFVTNYLGADFTSLPQCRSGIKGKKMLWDDFNIKHSEFANSIAAI